MCAFPQQEKAKALASKKEGDTAGSLEYMKGMKRLQTRLQEVNSGQAAPAPTPVKDAPPAKAAAAAAATAAPSPARGVATPTKKPTPAPASASPTTTVSGSSASAGANSDKSGDLVWALPLFVLRLCPQPYSSLAVKRLVLCISSEGPSGPSGGLQFGGDALPARWR